MHLLESQGQSPLPGLSRAQIPSFTVTDSKHTGSAQRISHMMPQAWCDIAIFSPPGLFSPFFLSLEIYDTAVCTYSNVGDL